MEAFVSGQAARVVYVQGMDVSYIEADNPTYFHIVSHTQINSVLGEATDVERMVVNKHEDAFNRLLEKYNFDRCFRMLDIAISEDEDLDTRVLAAEVFSEIAEDEATFEVVKNYLFSCFNSDIHVSDEFESLFGKNKFFVNFISDLVSCQIHIISFDEALNRALKNNEIAADTCAKFKHRAIDTGLFRSVVEAKRDGKKVEDAVLRGYLDLKDISSSRLILQDWTSQFLAQKSRRSLKQLESDFENYRAPSYQPRLHEERNRYEIYLGVQRQQNAIIDKLIEGDHGSARRFTGQMIKAQVSKGDTEYAAKSLTKLATEARRMGLRSIELEWAKWATELAPEDGVAMGMLADTYLDIYRFKDAEKAFNAAAKLGEPEFGVLGLARMQRMSGDPIGALEAITKIKASLPPKSANAVYVWQGYCGTLRDLYRFEEALEAVDEACDTFPNEPSLLCIRANILSDVGEFDRALKAYDAIILAFPGESVPRCGKAWAFFKIGELSSALDEFESVIQRFPADVNGYIGRATVLRDSGKHPEALEAFMLAASKFPYSPAAFCGVAETFREMGSLNKALSAYDDAISKFDLEIVARNGRANILKVMGNFKRALQEYDRNVKDFPYNLYALSGRADLLRRLGNYDDAMAAYDLIIDRHPDQLHAKVSKSAILIAQNKFDEAFDLLPVGPPKTESEWIGLHVRGIASLYKGELGEAATIFSRGSSDAPFHRQRIYFRTALASTKLRMRDFEGASELLSDARDPISHLLLVHSLAEMGQIPAATQVLMKVDTNLEGAVGQLRMELGTRYRLIIGQSKFDERWLFEKEAEAFLQAA